MNTLPVLRDGANIPLVQMIAITINGTRYGLVGPVVLAPGLMQQHVSVDVSEIEFGEIMSAHTAARMLEGDFRNVMGADIQ
jgi:hypothetical protein